jgi:hypothetical protein
MLPSALPPGLCIAVAIFTKIAQNKLKRRKQRQKRPQSVTA